MKVLSSRWWCFELATSLIVQTSFWSMHCHCNRLLLLKVHGLIFQNKAFSFEYTNMWIKAEFILEC